MLFQVLTRDLFKDALSVRTTYSPWQCYVRQSQYDFCCANLTRGFRRFSSDPAPDLLLAAGGHQAGAQTAAGREKKKKNFFISTLQLASISSRKGNERKPANHENKAP